MQLDTKYQNVPEKYTCKNCGTIITAPKHCGYPMHFEEINSQTMWVCWMGEHCGTEKYTPCCDTPELQPLI